MATAVVTAAVEGPMDEAALRRICRSRGVVVGDVYGRRGKQYILGRVNGFNNSAQHRHWVVLVDLDDDYDCAPIALPVWMANPATLMCFRIVVRELEAWLLADAERIAEFLGVRRNLIPHAPETLPDPKATLINLARQSRTRAIREDIVPEPGTGQSIGPAYSTRLIQFIRDINRGWRPDVAAQNAPSLASCAEAIAHLAQLPFPAANCGI